MCRTKLVLGCICLEIGRPAIANQNIVFVQQSFCVNQAFKALVINSENHFC